jgi:hypothetical protein
VRLRRRYSWTGTWLLQVSRATTRSRTHTARLRRRYLLLDRDLAISGD